MKSFLLNTICLTALTSSVSAVTISLDYTNIAFFDTGTADGLAARAAVDAAASDLSAAITSNLAAFTTYSHSGTAPGGSSATLPGTLGYTNPDTDNPESFTGSLAQNEFKVFVGARSLGGSTLGQGGPGSVGIAGGTGSIANDADFQIAVDNASSSFTSEFGRDSTVLASTLSGSFGSAAFTVNYGPTIGNLWFDNDGSSDFQLDHTIPVVAGKVDLYSVAIHEILHALGVGTYNTWDAQISGVDWTGPEVIALLGSGSGLIDLDGGHIADNTMSARLSDGVLQEVVMGPSITAGTRKELTELDLAFLRDLGFETVPEPSSTLMLALGSFAFIIRRRK